jgi:hypothetical protein
MWAAEWMTAEQAAKYLGCESVKAFEKIAAREGIPALPLGPRLPVQPHRARRLAPGSPGNGAWVTAPPVELLIEAHSK